MLFDILAVFVVTLLSSLFLCTTSVHGLPTSPLNLHYIQSHRPSPSLRLLHHYHHPLPNVDSDVGSDVSQMPIGESNEIPTIDDNSPSIISSFDTSNEPFDSYLHRLPTEFFSRKLLLSLKKKEQEQKRSTPSSISASSSFPTQFKLHSAVATKAFTDPSHANNVVNLSQLSESTRLSPSLKILVETNPFARAWLTMLLQKVMEEQPVPYIFKYGRRRKK